VQPHVWLKTDLISYPTGLEPQLTWRQGATDPRSGPGDCVAEPVSGPGTGTTVSVPSDPGTVWLIRCLAQHGDYVADPVSGFKEKYP